MALLLKLSMVVCFVLITTASPCEGFIEAIAHEAIVQDCCDALNSSRPDIPMEKILKKYLGKSLRNTSANP